MLSLPDATFIRCDRNLDKALNSLVYSCQRSRKEVARAEAFGVMSRPAVERAGGVVQCDLHCNAVPRRDSERIAQFSISQGPWIRPGQVSVSSVSEFRNCSNSRCVPSVVVDASGATQVIWYSNLRHQGHLGAWFMLMYPMSAQGRGHFRSGWRWRAGIWHWKQVDAPELSV